MLFRFACPLIFASLLAAADDSAGVIRVRESALSTAIRSADGSALSELLEADFRYYLSYQCAVERFDSEASKEDWIRGVTGLRIRSYRVRVTGAHIFPLRTLAITVQEPSGADANLDESWTITSDGQTVHKRFETVDLWKREGGVWKLVRRDSVATQMDCARLLPMIWDSAFK